ncbi:MAG: S-layer homology domain-containing protein [Flavonifractor plautii]
MRNLKRTLSLVMAMALIVGMMVVSASAVSSDFNDSAEITNTEAVDVMTAIGVFEGTDKGAFNPTGILTREQARQDRGCHAPGRGGRQQADHQLHHLQGRGRQPLVCGLHRLLRAAGHPGGHRQRQLRPRGRADRPGLCEDDAGGPGL